MELTIRDCLRQKHKPLLKTLHEVVMVSVAKASHMGEAHITMRDFPKVVNSGISAAGYTYSIFEQCIFNFPVMFY